MNRLIGAEASGGIQSCFKDHSLPGRKETVTSDVGFMSIEKFQKKLEAEKIAHQKIENVLFSLKEKRRRKHTGQRDLLLVSTLGLSDNDRLALAESLKDLRDQYISFPIKERSKHLMVRFRHQIYNYGYWPVPWVPRFRVWPSTVPSKTTIETMVPIDQSQSDKLASYIQNIRKRRRRVIGGFQNEGCQWTQNRLENNRPIKGGHNCTSWVATAPVASDEKSLMEAWGGDRKQNFATNPGWWSSWLLSQSQTDAFVIYWDNRPLEEMKSRIDGDGYLTWDFKRM